MADTEIKKKALAGMQRQLLAACTAFTHRLQFLPDGLAFFVQIHLHLDVAGIRGIITNYVVFATGRWGQVTFYWERAELGHRRLLRDDVARLFRETKRRIVNKPLERKGFLCFYGVSSLFHEAECQLGGGVRVCPKDARG